MLSSYGHSWYISLWTLVNSSIIEVDLCTGVKKQSITTLKKLEANRPVEFGLSEYIYVNQFS